MANYNTLISAIQAVIRQNGNNEITGDLLQQTLLAMISSLGAGYQFVGVAQPSTNPGTPDQKVFYIAGNGTYPNFGPTTVPDGYLGIFTYDTGWHYQVLEFPIGDGSITTAKLADGVVTDGKLAASLLAKLYSTGYKFAGVATTSTNPGTPNQNVFYIAGEIGTYLNFGNLTASEDELTVFYYDNIWHKSSAVITTGHPVEVTDASNTNLDIKDENRNILVRFAEGHIQTKYFDSREIPYDVLSKFKGKKMAIIGDSISTYEDWLPSDLPGYDGASYATYYPSGNVNNVQLTWWFRTAMMLGLAPGDINNCSWSGSYVTTVGSVNSDSTASAKPGCSTRRISDLSIRGWSPDIVLISISCNDWANNVSVGSWAISDAIPAEGAVTTMREAYALMLNKIHTTYPAARVFCCTNMDDLKRDKATGWPSNNSSGVTTYQWNANIKEIAEAFGCDVINLHDCGINYSNAASYTLDSGLHPNADGMELMARKVFNELISKY